MPRKPYDPIQAKIDILRKNLIIKLALNKDLRYLEFAYDFLGLDKKELSNPRQEIVNIQSTVETLVERKRNEYRNRIESDTERHAEDKPEAADNTIRTDGTGSGNKDDVGEVSKGESDGSLCNDKGRDGFTSLFIPKFPDQKATLTTQESHGCEQLATAKKMFDDIYHRQQQGNLLIAPGGSGKTYIMGSILKNLQNVGFYADCLSPWPALYISKVSIIAQTKQVLKEDFNLDLNYLVHVINIEMIRAALVGTLIEEVPEIVNGEEILTYRWRKSARPRTIFWDESQGLAREDSLQSTIANALYDDDEDAPWKTYEIDASATPMSKIVEGKHFALSTRKVVHFNYPIEIRRGFTSEFLQDVPTNKLTWGAIKKGIIAEVDSQIPETDYSPEVTRNFIEHYKDHVTWIRNIKTKHKGYLEFRPIDFEIEELREEYNKAEEAHQRRKGRLEGNSNMSEGAIRMGVLASIMIFSKAAENCKRFYAAEFAHNQWEQGYAPAFGFCFKQTACSVIRILMEKYGWSRDDISIIWGGSTETLSAKKKLAKRIKGAGEKGAELLDELGIDIEEDLGLDVSDFAIKTDEQYEWEKEHGLLTQKPQDRERERLRYIRQDSKFALFSYKSGGVGLSLHHQEGYPKARPRRGIFTPDYSEKLGVQALYRLPRLTSISDTYMWYVYYKTSIEKNKMETFLYKCKSMQEVTQNKEFWTQEEELNNIEIKEV